MEDEKFFSGYCRMTDSCRTVTAQIQDRIMTGADCCYGNCPFQASCPIARELDLLK